MTPSETAVSETAVAPNAGIFRDFHAAIVGVPDMAGARAWYEGTLQLTPTKVTPGPDGSDMLAIYRVDRAAHICLFVHPKAGIGDPARVMLNFRSDDADATRATLQGAGAECSEIQDMGAVRYFSTYDPFGNRIDVCQFTGDWLPYLD